jgi:hypothetical protein
LLLNCSGDDQAKMVMGEVDEGICGTQRQSGYYIGLVSISQL